MVSPALIGASDSSALMVLFGPLRPDATLMLDPSQLSLPFRGSQNQVRAGAAASGTSGMTPSKTLHGRRTPPH